MSILGWILTLAIVNGQLIRIPLGTGAVNLLDITVIILCLLGLYQIKLQFKKSPPFVTTALIFISIAVISLLFTPLHLNTQEYLTSLSYTIRFLLYISLGWLVFSGALLSLKENIHQILLFSGIGLATLGLLQFIFLPNLEFLSQYGWDPHYFRTVSTLLDPNFAGAYFALTSILLMSLRGVRQWRMTWQSILPFILVYLALLTTFSRSSYLMFLISGSLFALWKKSQHLIFLVLTLFLGLMVGFYIYTATISLPRNIDRTQSAQFRLNTWQQGLIIFQKSPLLGVGYNSYRYALREFNLADEKFISSHGASSNDSSLLSVLATTGVVGIITYSFFLFSLVKHAWGKNLILISGLTGLLIHSFFANSLFFPPIFLWIILTSIAPKK